MDMTPEESLSATPRESPPDSGSPHVTTSPPLFTAANARDVHPMEITPALSFSATAAKEMQLESESTSSITTGPSAARERMLQAKNETWTSYDA